MINNPIIIPILSGKGGVGKTMISSNLAYSLWKNGAKVLLMDFDFYNRGLSASLMDRTQNEDITVFSILMKYLSDPEFSVNQSKGTIEFSKVSILNSVLEDIYSINSCQIEKGFSFISSTKTGQLIDWHEFNEDINTMTSILSDLFERIKSNYEYDFVIIDATAGPSPLNIAIAGLSSIPIIVSETNRITWDGTLNFRNYISTRFPKMEIYFILNKVGKKFDIERFNATIKDTFSMIFKSLRIISYIPFEYSVFESFGDIEFILDEKPRWIFSRKIHELGLTIIDEVKDKKDHEMLEKLKHVEEGIKTELKISSTFINEFKRRLLLPLAYLLVVMMGIGFILVENLTGDSYYVHVGIYLIFLAVSFTLFLELKDNRYY